MSYQDPNSIASVGKKLQAMKDQSAADQLYDPKTEAFCGGMSLGYKVETIAAATLALVGVVCIFASFTKSRRG